jgi:hypothetical protein
MSVYKIRDDIMQEAAINWNGKTFSALIELNSFETAIEIVKHINKREYEYIEEYRYLKVDLTSKQLREVSVLPGVYFIWRDDGEI